ncbi:Biotin-requiring enzyme [Gaiella occulta]|uniref:Biotin-requiring enzyme n=1 Tax=Gaiella occulta TaxID=1002870 RepID=A0A7M2YUC0_9ACTN|nr:lipoyl domain-containing protein [Gaiella occulta]RDI73751.1 Biotin-requiring enzyme [Gaiella occulta]
MAVEVRLERLSEQMEYGTVSRWLKREGDAVAAGEPIVEVEAEKVTVEVIAPVSGVLTSILAVQGDEFRVETPIALITEDA